jgi:hypothetical protein
MQSHKEMMEALIAGEYLGNSDHETLYLDEDGTLTLNSNAKGDISPFQRVFRFSSEDDWHILTDPEYHYNAEVHLDVIM